MDAALLWRPHIGDAGAGPGQHGVLSDPINAFVQKAQPPQQVAVSSTRGCSAFIARQSA